MPRSWPFLAGPRAHFHPMLLQELDHGADIGEPRHVVQRELAVGQQSRDHQRQRGVLGARDADLAFELTAALDTESVHGSSSRQILGRVTPRWP